MKKYIPEFMTGMGVFSIVGGMIIMTIGTVAMTRRNK